MDGREFLQSARHLLSAGLEANWRSATGRAYYALLHEGHAALDRWGFPLPPRENIHPFVRLRLVYARHPDANQVGRILDQLGRWRNLADYHLGSPGVFATPAQANQAVGLSQTMIALLDAIETDPARLAAVIAAIRAAWP